MRLLAKPSRRLIVVVLLLASAVTTLLGPAAAGPLRKLVHYVLPPFGDLPMYLTTEFKRHVGRSPAGMSAREARLRRDNDILQRRLAAVEGELSRRLGAAADMNRARLGPVKDFPCDLIPARVVAADSLPYARTRLVNVGVSDGVRPGLRVTTRELLTDRSKRLPGRWAAITPTALVGRIIESGAFAARLQLITDRGFQMRALIERDPGNPREITVTTPGGASVRMLNRHGRFGRVAVWVRGDGTNGLTVPSVPARHNVLPGDSVITSDDEAFLPANVRIGRVTRVVPDPDHAGFVTLVVTPSADLASVREVYIVVPLGKLGAARDKAKR